MIALIPIVLATFVAQAQYAQVDPAIKDWISKLAPVGSNGKPGARCCDLADGLILQDTQWEFGKDSYRVYIVTPEGRRFSDGSEARWFNVPSESVVVEANKVGHALVWVTWSYDTAGYVNNPTIRCFLPGTGG